MLTWAFGLEFTPLEFETLDAVAKKQKRLKLEFTPLEFETLLTS